MSRPSKADERWHLLAAMAPLVAAGKPPAIAAAVVADTPAGKLAHNGLAPGSLRRALIRLWNTHGGELLQRHKDAERQKQEVERQKQEVKRRKAEDDFWAYFDEQERKIKIFEKLILPLPRFSPGPDPSWTKIFDDYRPWGVFVPQAIGFCPERRGVLSSATRSFVLSDAEFCPQRRTVLSEGSYVMSRVVGAGQRAHIARQQELLLLVRRNDKTVSRRLRGRV
jgi:hypothetical protein